MKISSDAPNLDVLRSFAVLAVSVSHLYRYCFNDPRFATFAHNIGVGGVCFFFVHTCLVLFGSMERTKSPHLTRDFYIRRAFRIYPLCWVCIVLVLATKWTDVPLDSLVEMGHKGIIANFALVQNFTHGGSVVGPLWSLPWEVQMYLALPPLFLLLIKSSRPVQIAVCMWIGLTALAVCSTIFHVPSVLHAAVYPPMFFGGIVAYFLCIKMRPIIISILWLLVVPVLLVGRCLLLRGDSMMDPHNVTVNAIVCLTLGLCIPLFKAARNKVVTHSAFLIAKYSYGIYLFHIPTLMFLLKYFGAYSIAFKIAAYVVITAAVSVLGYHLVEHPLIDYGKRLANHMDRVTAYKVEQSG